MKGPNQNPLNFFSKLFNVQLHLLNLLFYFLVFGGGLTLGMVLSFYMKDFSFSLQLAQFSFFSTSTSASNPHNLMPNVKAVEPNTSHRPPHVGLKEYLKTPEVFHDMDDVELLWRASMSPRISEYPFPRVPKVAFLFLVKGPVLLAPLWEKFFKGHKGLYSIYVHSNPSYNGSHPESPVFHGRRIPSQEVEWGNVNMIEAERRLLANALLDISNQRFILLSESCIPLHNFSTVYNYLVRSNETFVGVYDDPSSVGRGRYNSHMYPQISLSQWRKGSQWFEIDRSLAIEVVSDKKYFPVFQTYCRGSCYADEHYLPTYVNINFAQKNSNRSLTWVDWSRGGPHPAKFTRTDVTVEFLNSLRNRTACIYNGRVSNAQDPKSPSFFPISFNLQRHLLNYLSYFLLFVFGLTLGVVLSNLRDHSFGSLQFAQIPFSPVSPPPPSNISETLKPNATSPTTSVIGTNTSVSSSPPRIGLKDYLKPPKAFHDMNNAELLWRASMTPRIPEYPFRLVPKVAFMFLTRGPVVLAPLWEKFFAGHHGLYSIYVHSSPSYNHSSYAETPVFRGRRIPSQEVEWGTVSLIEAERLLLANALLDISNQRFVLLSDACIPLYNFSTVYSYLINSTQTFVEVYDNPNGDGRGRYGLSDYPGITIDQWRKGSQWFQADRDLALEFVSDRKYFPVFMKCKGYCFSDEHYLPTFVSMKFGAKNANRTLTWVDWEKGGPHPTEYATKNRTAELLSGLRNGFGRKCEYNGRSTDVCFLFARKFPPTALDNLLKFAPEIMHFNT
ncbi:hypothetical protein ACFX10_011096 [Malus domestica]